MKKAKIILKEMIIGLFIWSMPVLVILTLAATNKPAVICGVIVGVLSAAGIIFHMYKHLDIALDMDPENARKHTLKSAFQRTFIMAAVLTLSMIWYGYIHPIGVVLGLMGVKMTAYIQPYVHKFLQKKSMAG
jgi:ATP synthase I chain